MSSLDPSSPKGDIIPQRVHLKWLLLLFSCSIQMMRLGRFLADGVSTVYVSTGCIPTFKTSSRSGERRAGSSGSCQFKPAAEGKYGQIWPALSIMSRWERGRSNYQFRSNHQSGCWFVLSTLLCPLWWFLLPSVSLSQGSPSFFSWAPHWMFY